jgi:hypothetical protein
VSHVRKAKTLTLSFSKDGAEEFLKLIEHQPFRLVRDCTYLMELHQKLSKMLKEPDWQ